MVFILSSRHLKLIYSRTHTSSPSTERHSLPADLSAIYCPSKGLICVVSGSVTPPKSATLPRAFETLNHERNPPRRWNYSNFLSWFNCDTPLPEPDSAHPQLGYMISRRKAHHLAGAGKVTDASK